MTNPTFQDRVDQSNKELQSAYNEFCQENNRNPKLNWDDFFEVTPLFEPEETFEL